MNTPDIFLALNDGQLSAYFRDSLEVALFLCLKILNLQHPNESADGFFINQTIFLTL